MIIYQEYRTLFLCLRLWGKQADWVKSGGTGKIPQPEADRKQVGWGENGGTGKIPQPEAKRKQAGWVKSGETG